MKPLIHYNDHLPDLVRRMEEQTDELIPRILLVTRSRHMISALDPYGFEDVRMAQDIDHRSVCTSARFLQLARELERSKNQDINVFLLGAGLLGNHRSKISRAYRRLRVPHSILFSDMGFDPTKAFRVAVGGVGGVRLSQRGRRLHRRVPQSVLQRPLCRAAREAHVLGPQRHEEHRGAGLSVQKAHRPRRNA